MKYNEWKLFRAAVCNSQTKNCAKLKNVDKWSNISQLGLYCNAQVMPKYNTKGEYITLHALFLIRL